MDQKPVSAEQIINHYLDEFDEAVVQARVHLADPETWNKSNPVVDRDLRRVIETAHRVLEVKGFLISVLDRVSQGLAAAEGKTDV